jgi:L-alanine-DL-glutamate epimerase-like enolase superfamily enzyme
MLAVPDRPGFGITLDKAAVEKYTIASATVRM